jgi:membrane fusion protein, multidrug efflux system
MPNDKNPTRDGGPLLLGDGTRSQDVEMRALEDEYARLREEVEHLREEQKTLKEQKKDAGKDDSKKEEGKQDESKKDEPKQDEPKQEPLRVRASRWASAHPMAVFAMVVGFVVLLVAGYFLWRYLESYESTDNAEVDGHINQIASRVGGTVVGVYVENTQTVKAGQVVVELDPRDYQVALAQGKANLAQAQANVEIQSPNVPITATTQATQVATTEQSVESAAAGVASAERMYESSRADLRQAEADAANAAVEERRYHELVVKQEVSREQYDQRATAAKAQEALVASRRSAAEAQLKLVDQRRTEWNQARQRAEEARANQPRQVAIQRASVVNRQASAQAAKAQLDQATLNLSYTKILAPVDGIIGDKSVEVGMQVAVGQEMFAITQIDDIWVTANFKETQIRRMHAGQSVTIQVDTLGQDFDGYIENLAGATGAKYSLLPPENATGNYVKVVQRLPVRIRFKNGQKGQERLRPGMSVEPKVWVE